VIFRYPGGKHRLLPYLFPHLDRVLQGAKEFADVFVGGGSVLLHVAKRHPNLKLHANDLDDHVAAFWRTVGSHRVDSLCERLRIRPTVDHFYEIQDRNPTTDSEKAFRLLFLNRTAFSGIWWGNPIGGARQASSSRVFSRWNPKRMVEEIQQAHSLLKGRLTVTSQHGADYVRLNPNAPKYVDPPYFGRGARLYRIDMGLADHMNLADALRSARNWVLSYDDSPVVRELYSYAEVRAIQRLYKFNQMGTGVKVNELVIVPVGRHGDRARRQVQPHRNES
jgi:DNA adenine methylase